jgi:hypothetical protein
MSGREQRRDRKPDQDDQRRFERMPIHHVIAPDR